MVHGVGSWLLQILLEVEMIHLKGNGKSRPIRILARAELTKSMIHIFVRGAQNRILFFVLTHLSLVSPTFENFDHSIQ